MNLIEWCNDNNGFLTAILSFVGLGISITAIMVSIRTARLPYKKRVMLGSSKIYAIPETECMGLVASATNVGNRTVTLTYLGYATKKKRHYNLMYALYSAVKFIPTIMPSEVSQNHFDAKELIKILSEEKPNEKVYVYATDTEGASYKKKVGTARELIKSLME